MTLDKNQFLAAFEPTVFEVPVQSLAGAIVRFRELSGAARDALYESVKSDGGNSAFEARLIALTVVDERSDPVFCEDDMDAIRGGGKALLEELSQIAMRVNGLGAKAHEYALKN